MGALVGPARAQVRSHRQGCVELVHARLSAAALADPDERTAIAALVAIEAQRCPTMFDALMAWAADVRRSIPSNDDWSSAPRPIPTGPTRLIAAIDAYLVDAGETNADDRIGLRFAKATVYNRYDHFECTQ